MTEICAIINVHREGLLAHTSVQSAVRAADAARAHGISVELLVVADCPDQPTRDYVEGLEAPGLRVLTTDVDDLGCARNVAVQSTSCEYVAFLDGDDLWAQNWLKAAYACATQDDRQVIWHPEGSLFFGEAIDPYWLMHPDMDDDAYAWLRLASQNLWTSLAFASKRLFDAVPYRRTTLGEGFGFEDWAWNAQTISFGAVHKIVPGTSHLVRVKPSSLLKSTEASGAMMIPSDLFRDRLKRVT
ncbi:MAG: glycosyltransferase family 2 protein [Phenylobacterium sp.]|uniref:glycosyltransferase family A protein n=1 Tax=Phenylobacterium sp. TaxID=1871053 RepID=UPI0025E95478|nr:glycosyltransferase family A protein [Phenylobacterium sp.]MBA4010685.1 glycosyltransferase family 2 protein [Phenylobacterium sp.]